MRARMLCDMWRRAVAAMTPPPGTGGRIVEALSYLILVAVERGEWRRAKAAIALLEAIVARRE